MSLFCVNHLHFSVQDLAYDLGIHPLSAAAKIGVWQGDTGIVDRFPTKEELVEAHLVERPSTDYFALNPVIQTAADNEVKRKEANEIFATKKAMFNDIGLKIPSVISNERAIAFTKKVSDRNNELYKSRAGYHYRFEYTQKKGAAQNDNFTWVLRKQKGNIDIQAKLERKQDNDFEINRIPGLNSQGTAQAAQQSLSFAETSSLYSQQIIRKYAEAMQEQMGVGFEFITPDQAKELTRDAKNPWNGQKSFFFGGKIYFLGDQLTPSDILHEYIHPVVRSIAKQNKPLFNSLFTQLQSTHEGRAIIDSVTQNEPYLDTEADPFKEECLVRALEKKQDLNNKGLEVPSAFEKFINNLLFALRQAFRSMFGKISAQNIDTDTTLEELSKIIAEGGKFELDPEIISDRDFVMYKNEYNDLLKSFKIQDADHVAIQDAVNKYFDALKKQQVNIKNKGEKTEFTELLTNEYKTGGLDLTNKLLKPLQTLIPGDTKTGLDELEMVHQQVSALINSIAYTDIMLTKMLGSLKEAVKNIDDLGNVAHVLQCQKSIKYWTEVVKDTTQNLEMNGVSHVKMLDNVMATANRANMLVEDFYEKVAKDFLWEQIKDTAESINKRFEERLKQLKAVNASQKEIDETIARHKLEELTPQKLQDALSGNLKDVSMVGSVIEALSFSPDMVTGGLALAFKNSITEYELRSQAAFNDSAKILKPLLDAAGYTPTNEGAKGIELGQRERIGQRDPETGEFKEVEVWRFKNQFTGADLKKGQMLYKIKQAGLKYTESKSDTDKQALADAQEEWAQHRREYFNSEFTEEYYQAYDILKNDPIGRMAKLEVANKYDELNDLSAQISSANSSEVLDIFDKIEVLRREIKQMSSLFDIVGNLKTGDELEIAQRIQKFNTAVKDMYETEEIPEAFQYAYQQYEQKLLQEGFQPGKADHLFEDKMEAWLSKNTRTAIKDSFWEDFNSVVERIKEILSSLPENQRAALDIEEAYEEIKNLVKGNRDESGQPMGGEMTPEVQEKIKDAEERINQARRNLATLSGLTKDEQDEIQNILSKYTLGRKVSDREKARLTELLDRQSNLKLNKAQRAELNSRYMELDDLRSKEATDSYIDSVNKLLMGMDQDHVQKVLGAIEIDKETAFWLSDENKAQALMDESPEFEAWFLRNHNTEERVDYQTNEPYIRWKRSYAWNVITPRDDKYYEFTHLKNTAGDDIILRSLPSLRYYKRLVKDQYKTKVEVGKTVDNRGYGYWLPKTMAQGAKDDRYINKDYEHMRVSDPKNFALMEALKAIHLKNQEGVDNHSKLYLDFPRYRKHGAERWQDKNKLDRAVQGVKSFFLKARDDWDKGILNFNDDRNLIKMDFYDDDTSGIPITGTANLDIDEVSTNLVFTVLRHGLAAERHRALKKIAPMARIVQHVVNNEDNRPPEQRVIGNATIANMNKPKTRYVRAKAVNNYLEKVLDGEVNKGWGSDSAMAQKVSQKIFGISSAAYMNMNLPSALKNTIGMKFQGMIEALAGKHFTWKEFISSEGKGTATAFTVSKEIYLQGPKSLEYQKVEIFDPERDHFVHHYGESMSRTAIKDYSYLILDRMTDFRRWSQMQASFQAFYAMMKHQPITLDNGKTITYDDAFELVNDKIQTKAGVPKEWAISYDQNGAPVFGAKFLAKRNQVQRVLDNLNGAMGKEDRPEADRYLLYRYLSFFRRFLTSMITNRFAYSGELTKGTARGRYDYMLGDTKMGWYVEVLQLLGQTFRHGGSNLSHMTADQKGALLRLTGEAGFVALMKWVMLPLIFGWDPDDPDKFAKLRQRSDALPLPGVFDDPNREFNLAGWLTNHALVQTMQVAGENQQFLPLPGFGFDSYKDYLDVKSMAMAPTMSVMFNVVKDLGYIATGDSRAVYARPIGPWEMQQEGSYKIFSHIGKAFGLSGNVADPAKSAKVTWSIQNK